MLLAAFAVYAPWTTSCYLGHFAILVWPLVAAAVAKMSAGQHHAFVAAALALSAIGKGNEFAPIAAVAPAAAGWAHNAWCLLKQNTNHQLAQSVLDSV